MEVRTFRRRGQHVWLSTGLKEFFSQYLTISTLFTQKDKHELADTKRNQTTTRTTTTTTTTTTTRMTPYRVCKNVTI